MRRVTKTIELSTGRAREAIAVESVEIEQSVQTAKAGPIAISKEGRTAFIQFAEGQQGSDVGRIAIRRGNGEAEVCTSPECIGVVAIWWTKDGNDVRFIRLEERRVGKECVMK